MAEIFYKSFAYQFEPLMHIRLTSDIYDNIDALLKQQHPYWIHFEKPSKNLQQQLIKRLNIPKAIHTILLADESRPRCVKFDDDYVLIIQGIQPSVMTSDEDIPSLRFWITPQGLLSLSTGKVQAIDDLQLNIKNLLDPTPLLCLTTLLEYVIGYTEDSSYQIDEELNKIEADFKYMDETTINIMNVRQNIIFLRRYILPQRDALIVLANKLENIPIGMKNTFKELSDSMLRQVETIEMLRERAMVIQDNVTNQIGDISNRRMYLLTIVMLIFTPAFFIMGLFSMYMPVPGMNSKFTWWGITTFIIVLSVGLFVLFKKKKWL